MPSLPPDAQWIASAVQAPILVILAWMLHTLKRGLVLPPGDPTLPAPERCPSDRCSPDRCPPGADRPAERAALERTRDELAAFKLEVARTYVPLSLIRERNYWGWRIFAPFQINRLGRIGASGWLAGGRIPAERHPNMRRQMARS